MEESVLSSFLDICERSPSRALFTFVDEKGNDQRTLRAGELADGAQEVACALRRWGVAAGERVALVYPPSLDFIEAFVGCMAAGVIPVPVYPPHPLMGGRDLVGFSAIIANCGARVALTNGEYDRMRKLGRVTGFLGGDTATWPKLTWRRTDRLPRGGLFDWHLPADASEPAFLQYTSGSTGQPKGVVITHGNLTHEVRANARDLGFDAHSRLVSWVPLYHDLGLISGVCSVLSGNGHFYFMSPQTFIERPAVWFDVMSRARATHAAGPNFALEYSVRKTTPEMRKQWDLSDLRVLLCAAEPIRAETVRRFMDAFAVSRLNPDSFYPAYGLAEHTVSISMGGKAIRNFDRDALARGRVVAVDEGAPTPSVVVVGCGRITKPEARVRIVDPETRTPRGPDEIGEIWVESPTKASGYFGLDTETEETFRATVIGDDDPNQYLRTGDLGFFFEEELFIVGRCKDLIIIRGRNLYPQDLEDGIRDCHPMIRPGGVAAFSVDSAGDAAGERLMIVVEARSERLSQREIDEIIYAVRRRLLEQHQVACHTVYVGIPGTIRKTTSGKVRRSSTRKAILNGEVQSLLGVETASETSTASETESVEPARANRSGR
jgi:acyl-CoA synthetase (AMP-forming)/AMP-acid ligase II